jgi:hypothetical protein
MMAEDLFGEIAPAAVEPPRGKHYTKPKGYVAPPGSGPESETCGSCEHIVRCVRGRKRWHKCGLNVDRWTHGRGSDVLARTPACREWEKEDDTTQG